MADLGDEGFAKTQSLYALSVLSPHDVSEPDTRNLLGPDPTSIHPPAGTPPSNPNHLPPRSFKRGKRRSTAARTLWQATTLLLFTGIPLVCGVIMYLVLYPHTNSMTDDGMSYCSTSTLDPDILVDLQLSFEQARIIDITWNIVLGRGIQGIVAVIAYRLATQTLVRIGEVTPVPYDFFISAAFFPTSLTSILPFCAGMWGIKGWRPKAAVSWLVLTIILVLAVPLLFDAMTGYVQAQDYMAKLDEGWAPYWKWYVHVDYEDGPPYWNKTSEAWILPSSFADDPSNFACMPKVEEDDGLVSYRWGMSFAIFQATIFTLIAWGLGSWGLWMDARHNCQQQRKGRKLNKYSAIYDLGGAMKEEIGPNGGAYSGTEMAKALKKRDPVMYTLEESDDGTARLRLSTELGGKLRLSFDRAYK
ncbi:hypothetical protein MKZ38_008078 [Zalerion maritima]|uniref:Uncharacterized protein n=1 Tax=Zalerion maritima TaxID=339359 RepID=A0AAD5RUD1_9PEZI|nr:hypothetical protein MKZ38_008078 [Zalerion maritima]